MAKLPLSLQRIRRTIRTIKMVVLCPEWLLYGDSCLATGYRKEDYFGAINSSKAIARCDPGIYRHALGWNDYDLPALF